MSRVLDCGPRAVFARLAQLGREARLGDPAVVRAIADDLAWRANVDGLRVSAPGLYEVVQLALAPLPDLADDEDEELRSEALVDLVGRRPANWPEGWPWTEEIGETIDVIDMPDRSRPTDDAHDARRRTEARRANAALRRTRVALTQRPSLRPCTPGRGILRWRPIDGVVLTAAGEPIPGVTLDEGGALVASGAPPSPAVMVALRALERLARPGRAQRV